MTDLEDRSGSAPRRPLLLAVVALSAVIAAFLVSALAVTASPVLHNVELTQRADDRDVAFGLPVAWIHQDQSSLSPRVPGKVGLVSPWEYPTEMSAGVFLVNVLIVSAGVLAVAALLVTAATRGGPWPYRRRGRRG